MRPFEDFKVNAEVAASAYKLVCTQFESEKAKNIDEGYIVTVTFAMLMCTRNVIENSEFLSDAFSAPIDSMFHRWLAPESEPIIGVEDIKEEDLKAKKNIFDYFVEKLSKYSNDAYRLEATANTALRAAVEYINNVTELHNVQLSDETTGFLDDMLTLFDARAEELKYYAATHDNMLALCKEIQETQSVTAFRKLMALLDTMSVRLADIPIPSSEYISKLIEIIDRNINKTLNETNVENGGYISSDVKNAMIESILEDNNISCYTIMCENGEQVEDDKDTFMANAVFSDLIEKYGLDKSYQAYQDVQSRLTRIFISTPPNVNALIKEIATEFKVEITDNDVMVGCGTIMVPLETVLSLIHKTLQCD